MAYRYETHMHTCQASACGRSTGAEQARFYSELGYTGIFVTDHFTGGNTAVSRDLPWPERVDLFFAGYEDALSEGQKCGLDVFFAWEQNFDGDEYLIYGPDKHWLLTHPDVEHWTRKRQLEEIHRAGGAVIQAHPFRSRDYIKYIQLGLQYCDGIEAVNATNQPVFDLQALNYARSFDLVTTAGSDNHNCGQFDASKISGVALDVRIKSALEYADLIRRRGPIRLILPRDWLRIDPDACACRASYWIDESDPDRRRIPTGRTFLERSADIVDDKFPVVVL